MALRKQNLKVGLVAFIDLLGFSARVEQMKTTDDLEQLSDNVARVQRWFDYKPKDELIKETQTLISKTVLAFSDCIVVSVPIRSRLADQEGDFDVIMGELANFALSQGRCAVNGIFLRAGADFGIWYRNRDTLISPAMVKAYELERQASVPMIAVTNDLYEHLSEHLHRGYYHKSADPIPRVLRRYQDLPNGTAQWFIDYVPICLEAVDGAITGDDLAAYRSADPETRDKMRSEAFWRDCREWALCHAEAIRAAYAAAMDDHVRAKYLWLAKYHDDAVSRFYNNPPSEVLIGDLAA